MAKIHLSQAESERLVNRLRNTNLEKFYTMCKMHLSFLLDLPGSALEEFLNDGLNTYSSSNTSSTSEKSSNRLHFFGKKKSSSKEMKTELGITQEVIDQLLPLVEYLGREENITQEGLFRKNGHIGRQRLLREKLSNGEEIAMELEKGVYSAHDCASVLKTMLGELNEPVLTDRHYVAHLQVPEMTSESKQIHTLQLLIQLLPPEHLFLIQCLLDLLHRVTLCQGNKMTANTLGTLFAPHILVPRKMSPSALQAAAANVTRSVSFMIEKAPELFKIPLPLVRDIATYWEEMEEANAEDESDSCRLRYRKRENNSDVAINTTVTFTDRAASQQAAAQTDTQMALAQLYAHISSMPDSAKKRRLLKHFNKANGCGTPVVYREKHARTKSLGESIKKMVGRNHRRQGSGHTAQVHSIQPASAASSPAVQCHKGSSQFNTPQHTPVIKRAPLAHTPHHATPMMRLFKQDVHPVVLPSSPKVHIVDTKVSSSAMGICNSSRKRKGPGHDTPIKILSHTPFHSLDSPVCMSHRHHDGDDDDEDIENRKPIDMATPVQHLRSKWYPATMLAKKLSSPAMVSCSVRRYDKPTAYVSPISRSLSKAPLIVQANMMTPGSRAPMAVLQTP